MLIVFVSVLWWDDGLIGHGFCGRLGFVRFPLEGGVDGLSGWWGVEAIERVLSLLLLSKLAVKATTRRRPTPGPRTCAVCTIYNTRLSAR